MSEADRERERERRREKAYLCVEPQYLAGPVLVLVRPGLLGVPILTRQPMPLLLLPADAVVGGRRRERNALLLLARPVPLVGGVALRVLFRRGAARQGAGVTLHPHRP